MDVVPNDSFTIMKPFFKYYLTTSALLVWLTLLSGLALPAYGCVLRIHLDPVIPRVILPRAKPSSWEQENYFYGLLNQILRRTETEFGPCELARTEDLLTRMRSAALIDRKQGVDLFWGTTTIERENLLRPIRIPLLKGLMKHKVLLIHADDQARFSAIKNQEQLQNLRAGQGADWPDTTILLANGIDVMTSTNYESLYKMLAARRFDFLPRGSNEILSELRHNADKNIIVEQDLVLVYPAPVYFFVNKDNDILARRIEQGLRSMINDGSFDAYFYHHPLIVEALKDLRLNDRRAIYLNNPLLPEGAHQEDNESWMRKATK